MVVLAGKREGPLRESSAGNARSNKKGTALGRAFLNITSF